MSPEAGPPGDTGLTGEACLRQQVSEEALAAASCNRCFVKDFFGSNG